MSSDRQDSFTQITFHYTDGRTESFNVLWQGDGLITPQDTQQKLSQFLDKPWCILHLPEQTICINTANVLKVEMKPPLQEIKGQGVFSDVRRLTALNRSSEWAKRGTPSGTELEA